MIPVAIHLLQSTVFALAAALAFALRNKRAQVRYGIWLAASIKFMLPFSLFVVLGSRIEWTPEARPTLASAVQHVAAPLQALPIFFPASASSRVRPTASLISAVILALWICGFAAVLVRWLRRWLQVRAMVKSAVPLALHSPIPALSSPSLLEPGVFGIFSPVLLLPAGILAHLTPIHLEAILAHELCHVRRRDNLAAAFHMLVEAFFWFHPLVWWIGARLLEERERACDEEVVRLGNQPSIYAESILKTCQFYLRSPLNCVSGVTGSDLKQRIEHIMSGRALSRLTILQRTLLVSSVLASVTLPFTIGLAQTPAISFEVASIKPAKPGSDAVNLRLEPGAHFQATNVTLKVLMEEAYDVKASQLSGTPPWFDSDHYDVDAKPEEATGAALGKLSPDERREQFNKMLRSLIEDRFKLVLEQETKDLPVYALTVAKGGPKLKPSQFKPSDEGAVTARSRSSFVPVGKTDPPQPGGLWLQGPGHLVSTGIELPRFAALLSRLGFLDRTIVDKTGLTGLYDFKLDWTPDNQPPPSATGDPAAAESDGTSLFTALREQLGLKLESQKAPMPFLVIKHVEKPSPN